MKSTILATGGAGYIGSHVAVALMEAGHRVVILDDLSNAEADTIGRINRLGVGTALFVEGDVRDRALLDRLFAETPIDAVIHLAGLKAVGESVEQPLRYYGVNVGGAVALTEAMRRHGVGRLVFSSTATVYGEAEHIPIPETAPLRTTNPYAQTKLVIERILDDVAASDPGFGAVSLRYFNPVGAHPSGLIGDDPLGVPNNLFPFIAQTAAGLHDRIRVFGDDYPTRDGSCIRDYVHVVDLAEGHVAALAWLLGGADAPGGHRAVNLGCGRGVTVLEALAAFRRAVGRELPFHVVERRPGDVPELVADPALAERLFGWRATRSLEQMCADHWAFQRRALERRR